MKFGKKIQEAAHASVALCSKNCWLDYKRLKKVLKSFDFTPLQAENQNLEVQNDAELKTGEKDAVHMIKQNKDERRFFALLKKELEKVSNMFVCLEERSMNEVFQVLDALNVEAEKRQDQDVAELLSELVRVHGKLVLVRNFAVINYIGFTKILKKHDKVTGFTTRDKFMLKLVSDVPFSKHEALKCALEVLQSEYEAAKADGCIARNPKRNLLARELSMQALRQRQHRARSRSVASHSPQMLGFTASPMQVNKSIQLKRLLAPESVPPSKKVKVDVKNSLVSLATAAEIHTTKAT